MSWYYFTIFTWSLHTKPGLWPVLSMKSLICSIAWRYKIPKKWWSWHFKIVSWFVSFKFFLTNMLTWTKELFRCIFESVQVIFPFWIEGFATDGSQKFVHQMSDFEEFDCMAQINIFIICFALNKIPFVEFRNLNAFKVILIEAIIFFWNFPIYT